MSLGREMQYRTNILFGRLKNVMILLLIFFVFLKLNEATGRFAGYSETEIFSYLMGINILRGIIFGGQSRQMASEINNGMFSKYLVMPVNHFFYQFFYEAGQRFMNLFSAVLEVIIFALIFKINFYFQTDIKILGLFLAVLILALALYYVLSYLINMLAFWSREAMGPRFLFEWALEFASGAYFPLDILSQAVLVFLAYLPFYYIVFFPMSTYLGRTGDGEIVRGLVFQLAFIGLFAGLAYGTWRRGLKKYSGEGI